MGQRHQLFVIAKLCQKDAAGRGSYYRCLVAAHNQWLFGMSALGACKAFLDLVRNVENASIVRAELTAIEASYSIDDRLPSHVAPFLTSMLYAALTLRCEEKYESTCGMMDPEMGSRDGDNDDGITVLDVSDPLRPTYCFVSIYVLSAAVDCNLERLIALSAEQYVRAYYPLSQSRDETAPESENMEHSVVERIEQFKDEKLMKQWVLHYTWPHEGYGDDSMEQEPPYPVTAVTVPALTKLSLQSAITTAEKTGDISALETAMSLPGVGPSLLLSRLVELNHFSDEMFHVVLQCLREDSHRDQDVLDLSSYAFTSDQVVDTAACFPCTKVLNLSGNPNVNTSVLSRLLPNLPVLSRLNLYNCEGLTLKDFPSIRSLAPQLEAIYHRALMIDALLYSSEPIDDSPKLPKRTARAKPSFTFYFKYPPQQYHHYEQPFVGCSLISYSPRQVVTALCDFHELLLWSGLYSFDVSIRDIFSGVSRSPTVQFRERALGNLPEETEVAQDGWLYAVVPTSELESSSPLYSCGFVRYKFSVAQNEGVSGNRGAGDAKRTLEDVRVFGLTDWLKHVDPGELVEKEWRERLEDKLSGSESKLNLLSEEQARELLKTIPQFSEDDSVEPDA